MTLVVRQIGGICISERLRAISAMHLDESGLAEKHRAVFYVNAALANGGGGQVAVLTKYDGVILNLPLLVAQFRPMAVDLLAKKGIAYIAAMNGARGNLSSLTLGLPSPGSWDDPLRFSAIAKIQSAIYCTKPVAVIVLPNDPIKCPPLGGL